MVSNFSCIHCHQQITNKKFIGTHYRNHCPFCLWSKHVDLKKSGDRQSNCQSAMEPIGLTFKAAGIDNYSGKPKQGEIMVIHQCRGCNQIKINRIAGDDDPQVILEIFSNSLKLDQETKLKLKNEGINLLAESDSREIKTQLFGKY